MDTAEHIAALRHAGPGLMSAALRAGLDAAVPTCPKWCVRDLLAHIGGVHRWAAAFVAEGRTEPMDAETRARYRAAPPDDTDLPGWFADGHAALVSALEASPPDLDCWTFFPAPTPLLFWARRQAHETIIHRVDAELAAGGPVIAPHTTVAADGIDELLAGMLTRRGRLRADPPRTLAVRATDAGQSWLVHVGPDAVRTRRTAAPEPADCTLTGPAAVVYLLLWNRTGPEAVCLSGDPSLLDLWRDLAVV